MDMIRCDYIIKAYKQEEIIQSVSEKSEYIVRHLRKIDTLLNVRSLGLIMAFDLSDMNKRDKLVRDLYNNGLICNKTGKQSIRLRPNLAISHEELEHFIYIMNKTCGGL